jgi:hypothetical protein
MHNTSNTKKAEVTIKQEVLQALRLADSRFFAKTAIPAKYQFIEGMKALLKKFLKTTSFTFIAGIKTERLTGNINTNYCILFT